MKMYVTTRFTAAARKYRLDREKVNRLIRRIGDMNCGFGTNQEIRTRTDQLIRDLGFQEAVETRPTGRTDTRGDATFELCVRVEHLRALPRKS
jgi:hypothetical protein